MSPTYNYNCQECESTFEIIHAMHDKPKVVCPVCKSKKTLKGFNLFCLNTKTGYQQSMTPAMDQVKRNLEMKEDMRINMGIEKINPIGGSTMQEIYKEAKAQETQIKEDMLATREKNDRLSAIKNKKWRENSLMKAPERAKSLVARKAKESYKKNSITI